MKGKVSGACSIFVQGVEMTCPLCKVLVKSGESHECYMVKPAKKPQRKKGAR